MAWRGSHNGRYILQGKVVVPVEDLLEWARWIEEHTVERIVRQDEIGRYFVSTVFLGLDHDFSERGPPLVFETMVFRNSKDIKERESVDGGYFNRTYTWELALETHAEGCAWAREHQDA